MASNEPDSPRRLRVIANRSACCGYGVCAEICPEVFGLDDNGIVTLKMEWVSSELLDRAREGAQACPQSALSTEEVSAEPVDK